MADIAFIQVGYGLFGEGWADILMRSPRCALAALVDNRPEALEGFSRKYPGHGVKLCESLTQAFRETSAEALLIAVPNRYHRDAALGGMEKGLHILSEKPIADSWENAAAIYRAWRKTTELIYLVGQNYRLKPPIKAFREIYRSGVAGAVGYLLYEFHKAWKFGGWREEMTFPLLEDMAIHHFDTLRYVLDDEPETITMESFNPAWSWFSGNASAMGVIRFSRGIQVNYCGSWMSFGKTTEWTGNIYCYGDQGALTLEDNRIYHYPREGNRQEIIYPSDVVDEREELLTEFCRCVTERSESHFSLRDNIKTYAMMWASVEAAKSGHPQVVADLLRELEDPGG
ncbi:MAG TPA: Gfo/Idh/MocA family oxidoreductase [Atribacteraceae bacterium]|nr:Gfo/Idh/MocA family oxidoreductase [Atribacteraceae bacterium]